MYGINLERLVGAESAQRLRGTGLHKLAATRLRNEGLDVGEELTLPAAAFALGVKLREKNAQYKRIAEGLESLAKL